MSAKQSLFTSTEQMLVLGTEELSSQTIFIFLGKKREGSICDCHVLLGGSNTFEAFGTLCALHSAAKCSLVLAKVF